ncbi:CPBP family intramembrane metalloprotease [Secundilactobacillus kimchicus]|uniref:CPBP family intramembrane glutamic endopeptidase n=1 Tax=Secundilactobacillus kimchicus TaxID=528209 RepID=UPI001C017030|nr:CPBP family intramembrane metalloprotease [Secundilactobacillus kimchicus]
MAIVWVLISQIPGVFYGLAKVPLNFFDSYSFLLFSMFFEGIIVLVMWRYYKRDINLFNFTKKNRIGNYGYGWIAGFILFAVVWFAIVLLHGFTIKFVFLGTNLVWLILFLFGFACQSMFEEALCRGYVMGKLLKKSTPIIAIISNSFFFMILHMLNSAFSIIPAIGLLMFGVLMSLLRLYGYSLWFLGALHAAWNFSEGIIFGTSVSGIANMGLIVQSKPIGSKFINGGSFGPEGSITLLIVYAIVLGCLLLVRSKKRKNIF